MITHKGYIAKIEFDEDDKVLHGRILGIRDVITFEADSVEGAIAAFEESVDDYLAFCEERNKEPERPFSGNGDGPWSEFPRLICRQSGE